MTKDSFVLAGSNGPGSATSVLPQAGERSLPQAVSTTHVTLSLEESAKVIAVLLESLSSPTAKERREARRFLERLKTDEANRRYDALLSAVGPLLEAIREAGDCVLCGASMGHRHDDMCPATPFILARASCEHSLGGNEAAAPGEERGLPSQGSEALASTKEEAGQ